MMGSLVSIITNFLLILTVKEFANWLLFFEVIRHAKVCQFLGHPVYPYRFDVYVHNALGEEMSQHLP